MALAFQASCTDCPDANSVISRSANMVEATGSIRNSQNVVKLPIDTMADLQARFLRLHVNIAGARFGRIAQDQVDEANDRGHLGVLHELGRFDDLILGFLGGLYFSGGADAGQQLNLNSGPCAPSAPKLRV